MASRILTAALAAALALFAGTAHADTTHTVEPGDTLWRITSDRYGSTDAETVACVAERSGVEDPNLIYPGQTIELPDEPCGPEPFLLDFADPADMDQLQKERHHRNINLGYHAGHDYDGTWSGDHNLNCDGPQTQRVVHDRLDEVIYYCQPGGDPAKGHVMTSMGHIDGYSIVAIAPDRSFTDASRVCWDVNLTDLGQRQWWEAHLIPEAAFQANNRKLAYLTPLRENVDSTALPYPSGSVNVAMMFGETDIFSGRSIIHDDKSPQAFKVTSKAKRYRHCLTDNGDGTLTWEQERDTGTRTFTVAGAFPSEFRLIFTDHNYTPLKDGPVAGMTWHFDALLVE